jgi:hypothetical protein
MTLTQIINQKQIKVGSIFSWYKFKKKTGWKLIHPVLKFRF